MDKNKEVLPLSLVDKLKTELIEGKKETFLKEFDWRNFEIVVDNKLMIAKGIEQNFHSDKCSAPKRSEDMLDK